MPLPSSLLQSVFSGIYTLIHPYILFTFHASAWLMLSATRHVVLICLAWPDNIYSKCIQVVTDSQLSFDVAWHVGYLL